MSMSRRTLGRHAAVRHVVPVPPAKLWVVETTLVPLRSHQIICKTLGWPIDPVLATWQNTQTGRRERRMHPIE